MIAFGGRAPGSIGVRFDDTEGDKVIQNETQEKKWI